MACSFSWGEGTTRNVYIWYYTCVFIQIDYDTGFFRFAEIDYDADNEQIHVREYVGEDEQRPTVVEEWFYFREVSLV